MSEQKIKQAIANKKMRCPKCKQAIQKYEKYVEMIASVWDGPGDSFMETSGSKVTLVCGNAGCEWRDRTEYWQSFIEE